MTDAPAVTTRRIIKPGRPVPASTLSPSGNEPLGSGYAGLCPTAYVRRAFDDTQRHQADACGGAHGFGESRRSQIFPMHAIPLVPAD